MGIFGGRVDWGVCNSARPGSPPSPTHRGGIESEKLLLLKELEIISEIDWRVNQEPAIRRE